MGESPLLIASPIPAMDRRAGTGGGRKHALLGDGLLGDGDCVVSSVNSEGGSLGTRTLDPELANGLSVFAEVEVDDFDAGEGGNENGLVGDGDGDEDDDALDEALDEAVDAAINAATAKWSEVWDDESSQYYYYNAETQESTWLRPMDFDGDSTFRLISPNVPVGGGGGGGGESKGDGKRVENAAAEGDDAWGDEKAMGGGNSGDSGDDEEGEEEGIGRGDGNRRAGDAAVSGWVAMVDHDSGNTYYFNNDSGVTTWSAPFGPFGCVGAATGGGTAKHGSIGSTDSMVFIRANMGGGEGHGGGGGKGEYGGENISSSQSSTVLRMGIRTACRSARRAAVVAESIDAKLRGYGQSPIGGEVGNNDTDGGTLAVVVAGNTIEGGAGESPMGRDHVESLLSVVSDRSLSGAGSRPASTDTMWLKGAGGGSGGERGMGGMGEMGGIHGLQSGPWPENVMHVKSMRSKALIKGSLERSFVFSHLAECDRDTIADAMHEVTVNTVHSPNGVVVAGGGRADRFFVVDEGSLEVVRTESVDEGKGGGGGGGEETVISVLGPGDSFGDVALLAADCYHEQDTIRAIATTPMEPGDQKGQADVRLWAIHRAQYRSILAVASAARVSRIRKDLHSARLLWFLNEEELSLVAASAAVTVSLRKGDRLDLALARIFGESAPHGAESAQGGQGGKDEPGGGAGGILYFIRTGLVKCRFAPSPSSLEDDGPSTPAASPPSYPGTVTIAVGAKDPGDSGSGTEGEGGEEEALRRLPVLSPARIPGPHSGGGGGGAGCEDAGSTSTTIHSTHSAGGASTAGKAVLGAGEYFEYHGTCTMGGSTLSDSPHTVKAVALSEFVEVVAVRVDTVEVLTGNLERRYELARTMAEQEKRQESSNVGGIGGSRAESVSDVGGGLFVVVDPADAIVAVNAVIGGTGLAPVSALTTLASRTPVLTPLNGTQSWESHLAETTVDALVEALVAPVHAADDGHGGSDDALLDPADPVLPPAATPPLAPVFRVVGALGELEEIRVLARGAFGTVKIVWHIESDTGWALKRVSKRKVGARDQLHMVLREKRILRVAAPHPFIVDLEATFVDDRGLYLVLEYVCGGELLSLMKKEGALSIPHARFYTACVGAALDHMHRRRIVHRDLCPENILIDAGGYLKITDFGLSKQLGGEEGKYDHYSATAGSEAHGEEEEGQPSRSTVAGSVNSVNASNPGSRGIRRVARVGYPSWEERTHTLCGTPEYMAPEALRGGGYGVSADLWALGCLTFEMVRGFSPFAVCNVSVGEETGGAREGVRDEGAVGGAADRVNGRRVGRVDHRATFHNVLTADAQTLIGMTPGGEEGGRLAGGGAGAGAGKPGGGEDGEEKGERTAWQWGASTPRVHPGQWGDGGDEREHCVTDLVTGLLCRDTARRLGCGVMATGEVLRHPWFTEDYSPDTGDAAEGAGGGGGENGGDGGYTGLFPLRWDALLRREVEAPWIPSMKSHLDYSHYAVGDGEGNVLGEELNSEEEEEAEIKKEQQQQQQRGMGTWAKAMGAGGGAKGGAVGAGDGMRETWRKDMTRETTGAALDDAFSGF
jgi:serine/threonine protein kinase/CRP-like cAMP-binding protein